MKKTKQGRRGGPTSLLLAAMMTAQMVLPAFAAAEPELEDVTAPMTPVEQYQHNETIIPDEALPVAAQTIPGYTQVTAEDLDLTKVYMIVSEDSQHNRYAFYPDEDNKNADPGNSIDDKNCPAGALVAKVNVSGETVAAEWVKDQTALDMSSLHFTLEKSGDKWAFKGSNGLYLSMENTQDGYMGMLKDSPVYFSVTTTDTGAVKIQDGERILDLNVSGDENQFVAGSKTFNTNFWGPKGSDTRFPIYLYSKDGATVTPAVTTGVLRDTIAKAEAVLPRLSESSAEAIQSVIDSAKAVLEKADKNQVEVDDAVSALNQALMGAEPKAEFIAPGAPASGTTVGQPFASGTAGSQNFRIPALITLKNNKAHEGRLVAAIDARWNHAGDACALDTILSVSDDNGKTWRYSFPNFFNDSTNALAGNATAFIDPELVEGNDGAIYMMVDLFPGGVAINTAPRRPHASTGYEDVNGTKRLVLYPMVGGGQTSSNYTYYVGDFEGKFAPVIKKGETAGAAYYVDKHFYLYTADKKPMYCQQIGSDQYVHQNVFFYNADLHVRDATYLYIVKSTDGGETWGDPMIANPMIRKTQDTSIFYGVGPGAGLCLSDGTIMLTAYTFDLNVPNANQKCSFIYSEDKGATWHRSETVGNGGDWSSESCLVEIDPNTVRHFYRDGHNVLRYSDHTHENGVWKVGEPVEIPEATKTTNNQLSAIRYSNKINGQDVILVSTAATGTGQRQNGRVYALALEQDKTMKLIGSYEVTGAGEAYGYSSITEQEDGSIGLLYEGQTVQYVNIPINDIIPSAVVNGKRVVNISLYETVADVGISGDLPTEAELAQLNSSMVKAEIRDGKVFYTGLKVGETSYVSGDVTVTIKVTEPSNIESLTMNVGETKEIAVNKGQLTNNTNGAAVKAEVIVNDQSFVVKDGAQGREGENSSYSGTLKSLSSALYRFTGNSTDGFQIMGKTEDGTKVWVSTAVNHRPSSKTPETAVLTDNGDGTFFLKLSGGYLHFYRDGKNYFDRVGDTTNFAEACKFKLYRPAAEGEQSGTEIPGYIQVTQLSDVKDGGFYLIVATVGQKENFVLRPYISGNDYNQALKVDLAAGNQTTTVENKYYTLKLTAQAVGTADVVVDGQIYRVNVRSNSRPDYVSPDITENPDGSVTQKEERPDGTVVETTKLPNGDKVVTETKKDGTVATTETRNDGTVVETVTDKQGSTTAQITVPNNVDSVTVTVPTQNKPTTGTVAVVVKPDGTKEVIRKSMTAENGVVVPTDSSIKVEIVDNTKRFEDTKGHWAQNAIDFVTSRELYAGTDMNTFSPDQAMTRGMLVVVLYNRENNPAGMQNAMFPDVQNEAWYSEAVAWAVDQKIVSGYGDGKFGPDDQITREQLAVMLYQYAGAPAVNGGGSLNFADADQVSGYAQTAVRWAVENGIINGGDGNRVAPKAPATRAQVAAMMMNFCKNEMN